MKQILVATHSNGLNAEGVLGLVAVDNLARLGHITPQERASMADAVASAYNSGQISPYQLKWLISSYRHALGALTPVSDTLRSHPECRAAQ